MISKRGKDWHWPVDKYFPYIYRRGRYIFLRGCSTLKGARKQIANEKPPKGIVVSE